MVEAIPPLGVSHNLSRPSITALGFGLTLKSFRLDVTTSYHPQLGITPGVLMLFNFKSSSTKGE